MKFLGDLYVSCRSMSSELLVMVIRFKSGVAWPGSSAAPCHGAVLYREHWVRGMSKCAPLPLCGCIPACLS